MQTRSLVCVGIDGWPIQPTGPGWLIRPTDQCYSPNSAYLSQQICSKYFSPIFKIQFFHKSRKWLPYLLDRWMILHSEMTLDAYVFQNFKKKFSAFFVFHDHDLDYLAENSRPFSSLCSSLSRLDGIITFADIFRNLKTRSIWTTRPHGPTALPQLAIVKTSDGYWPLRADKLPTLRIWHLFNVRWRCIGQQTPSSYRHCVVSHSGETHLP